VSTSTIVTPLDHGSRKHSAKLTQILDTLEWAVLLADFVRPYRSNLIKAEKPEDW